MVYLKNYLLLGVFACSSIVFSAAYTIYMFNRTAFGGSFSKIIRRMGYYDVNKREFILLFNFSIIYYYFRYISCLNLKSIRLFYE